MTPWTDFRRPCTTPGGRRYRCKEIGSYARVQELLRQGHTYLDSNGDGEACESLRRWLASIGTDPPNRKPPAGAGGRGSHDQGLSPGKASGHQPSTFTVTVLTLLALGAVTVSSPSR